MPVDNPSERVERFHQAEAIFHKAVDATGADQERVIAQECAGDAALEQEVRGLLAAAEASAQAEPGSSPPVLRMQDRRLGPYQIDRLLGRGGMGAVYLAHRVDGQFEQTVAIKLVGLPFDFDLFREKFLRERQILAGLNHPNITRLLDGGVTADGELYLVMEYVEGDRLDVYCLTRTLPVPEKLRLFRAVCAAVQHAHQSLIVHRDIKPSNILVTADGTPKLLDFGTAKLLAAQVAEQHPTVTGSVTMLTPAYASPEQLRGEPVSTLSDVYSLGVLLFELLTGQKPFGEGATARLDPDNRIERPSAVARRANDLRLARLLSSDLDRIVSKALRPEPQERYASVEQLSADIGRYLDGEPILAHAPSLAYVGAKFVRRHAWGVAATALVLIGLAAATVFSLWQAREARQQATRAQRINMFMNQLLGAANPRWYNPLLNKGKNVTVLEVLDEMRGRIGADLADQPATEIELRRTIARTYTTLNQHERAHEQLEHALARQLALTGPNHPDVGRVYNDLSTDDYLAMNLTRAESEGRVAVSILRGAHTKADRETLMEASQTLGDVVENRGDDNPEPAELFRQALGISRELYGAGGSTPVLLADLGYFLIFSDIDSAEQYSQESLALFRAKPGGMPVEGFVPLHALGFARMIREDYPGAEIYFREAYAITQKYLGPSSPYTSAMREGLAFAIGLGGRYSEAERELNDCLASRRRGKSAQTEYVASAVRIKLAEVQMAEGNRTSAEEHLRAILALYRQVSPKGGRRVAYVEAKLGECLIGEGKREEGVALLKKGYEGLLSSCGPRHPYTVHFRKLL